MTLSPDENLSKLVDLISHSNQVVFGVIDKEKNLLGVIHFNDIREIIFKTELYNTLIVKELMTKPPAVILSTGSMEEVLKKFDETRQWNLPVVKDKIYQGFLSKARILSEYRSELMKTI